MKKIILLPYKSYKGEYYPIVKIQVKGPNGFLETEAYVDSGASISIFLTAFASYLGIDYTKGKLSHIMVGDGGFIPVYTHTLPIKIGPMSLKAKIGFSPSLGADFNLLGQKDIFDRFIITFNRPKRQYPSDPPKNLE